MSNGQQLLQPHLKAFGRLIGRWQISGDAFGQTRYEVVSGGHFILQHFEVKHGKRENKGLEVIGRLHGFGAVPSPDIHSRAYCFPDGMTLDYIYEIEGGTLTIWGGNKGSPAYYKGAFSGDNRKLIGSWTYPGGGYSTVSTRVD